MNNFEQLPDDLTVDRFVNSSFDLSDRIQEILKQKGISQKELAEMLDKKESQVSKWLTGTHNFTIKTLSRLEVALGEPIFEVVKSKSSLAGKLISDSKY